MKSFISFVIALSFVCTSNLSAQELSYAWQGTNDGWSGAGGCVATSGPDFLTMDITGNQPHIQSPQNLNLDSSPFESFTVTLRNTTPDTTC